MHNVNGWNCCGRIDLSWINLYRTKFERDINYGVFVFKRVRIAYINFVTSLNGIPPDLYLICVTVIPLSVFKSTQMTHLYSFHTWVWCCWVASNGLSACISGAVTNGLSACISAAATDGLSACISAAATNGLSACISAAATNELSACISAAATNGLSPALVLQPLISWVPALVLQPLMGWVPALVLQPLMGWVLH